MFQEKETVTIPFTVIAFKIGYNQELPVLYVTRYGAFKIIDDLKMTINKVIEKQLANLFYFLS